MVLSPEFYSVMRLLKRHPLKQSWASEMAQQARVATIEPTDELVLHPKDLHVKATEPTPAGAL